MSNPHYQECKISGQKALIPLCISQLGMGALSAKILSMRPFFLAVLRFGAVKIR